MNRRPFLLRRVIAILLGLLALAVTVDLGRGLLRDATKEAVQGALPKMPMGSWFSEVAGEMGLDYRWRTKPKHPLNILELSSAGAGFLDYDQDGWLDIVLVGPEGGALYHNDHGKRFARAPASVGFRLPAGVYHGCASADLDNDGFPELLVTGYRRQVLFRNRGGTRLENISPACGIASDTWGTSASFFDADRDGKVDLLLGSYVKFDRNSPEFMVRNGVKITLGPDAYEGEKLRFFRNLGDCRFREETQVAGFHSTRGKNFGTATCDFDNDGDDDVYVANDEMPGNLYVNDGKGHFVDRGTESGTSLSGSGRRQGGMGTTWGDYNNDGRFDLLVTTFTQEPKSLYRNDGQGLFTEVSYETQLTQGILPWVGFGVVFLDADRDGQLDVAMANGHVEDLIHQVDSSNDYAQPMKLFLRRGNRFVDATNDTGPGFKRSIVGRALAVGDMDNDGDADLLAADLEGPPVLLRSEPVFGARWIGFRLVGGPQSNRQALGARVTVRFRAGTQTREVRTDGSYLSTHDPRLLFGLHSYDHVDAVEVRWPSGKVERADAQALKTNVYYRWEEGKPPRKIPAPALEYTPIAPPIGQGTVPGAGASPPAPTR